MPYPRGRSDAESDGAADPVPPGKKPGAPGFHARPDSRQADKASDAPSGSQESRKRLSGHGRSRHWGNRRHERTWSSFPPSRSDKPDGPAPVPGQPGRTPTSPGFLIRAWLEKKHITQRDLARLLKMDLKTVNSLVCERTEPTIPVAVRIARELDESPYELSDRLVELEIQRIEAEEAAGGQPRPAPRRRKKKQEGGADAAM